MQSAPALTPSQSRGAIGVETVSLQAGLRNMIARAAHSLPSQGPITAFVHHNTLHALEDLPFEQAVLEGAKQYGCQAYLTEQQYREQLERGRIRVQDLEAVLAADLGDEASRLVACFGTRYSLRLAMLRFPLHHVPDAELRWLIEETDALDRFREEIDVQVRQQMVDQTRRWLMQTLVPGSAPRGSEILKSLRDPFGEPRTSDSWSCSKWESFVLRFLWRVCRQGVQAAEGVSGKQTSSPSASRSEDQQPVPLRHRDLLLAATGKDTDHLVHDILIRFCASYLDQGFATSALPDRELAFLTAFAHLYSLRGAPVPSWAKGLRRELREMLRSTPDPLESIGDSLDRLGVDESERQAFLSQTLLALPGWAGIIQQVEGPASWVPRPAPAGTLHEYLAIRLILERHAIADVARRELGIGDISQLRTATRRRLSRLPHRSLDQRAFTVFQIAQARGWTPEELMNLSQHQWSRLLCEIDDFSATQRRRVFHLAYERNYRHRALDAIVNHLKRRPLLPAENATAAPLFQFLCCLDEREESLRRHLEEHEPRCETFGIAGFFGVAMYYQGAGDAHFKPLCPANVTPRHYVRETPAYSLTEHSQRRALRRRTLGRAAHHLHVSTRSFFGGMLAGLFGSLAAFPLVARVLFPRTVARWRQTAGSMVQPAVTELHLERVDSDPGPSDAGLGYSVPEMVEVVEGALNSIGLTERFAPLVVISGHGSASMNNPHEAAHDCGACGGGRGGPNARAFAQMANDPRVRRHLTARGLEIPEAVVFVGAYHNTCDDSMTWYDLDRIPASHRRAFERARDAILEACKRDAHERARRFESAGASLSHIDALRHVQGRAEDLSQTRPEYGHATNALCFVGRRQWSRGLFLDRRAFLTSYDPWQDDSSGSILERLLQAVIPVCAGINLEYYFSYVDPTGYGCGTKLPHNITSLLGVMDGALSDLRTGLPWQMVEIHEPVRLLFVVETTPATMLRIVEANPPIKRLVDGGWIQLTVLDAERGVVHWFSEGTFKAYHTESDELPEVDSSAQWYRGRRDHLGFASVRERATPSRGGSERGAA